MYDNDDDDYISGWKLFLFFGLMVCFACGVAFAAAAAISRPVLTEITIDGRTYRGLRDYRGLTLPDGSILHIPSQQIYTSKVIEEK
jgi:hypothetical protein